MLVGQTAINFAANVLSAAFGLLNVVLFTRLFAPAEFGTYVLGAGFATIVGSLTNSWLRLPIMREQARGDGTDIRGIVVPGFALSCLLTPLAYCGALLAGIGSGPALADFVLRHRGFGVRPRRRAAADVVDVRLLRGRLDLHPQRLGRHQNLL
jgi:O-antigen/teichoic acid export membrane protein